MKQRVTYLNKRDVAKYSSVFTAEADPSLRLEVAKDSRTTIIKLHDPQFVKLSEDTISVSVHETYLDYPKETEAERMYTLKKRDGGWKIDGID
ncbi:hypothetical protein FHS18_005788 [Paenibacillus phyllosphaerae]|uniref:Uncharacterized protein n=1 Tax=Paenibacillus phyllosphaerae TaxID=274593 RepID=A0A7W5B3C6_9BACL|nr:hypothetical protein [Paenibacillus phyllosphaerae]MBB3113675.1 hypothetical protein [Paenibacillus phyllosphaerae]